MIATGKPAEPRWFTITDLMVLCVGFALMWSIVRPGGGGPLWSFGYQWLQGLPLAVACAIIARQYQSKRALELAEYATFFVAGILLSTWIPDVDNTISVLHGKWFGYAEPVQHWSRWRWSLASVVGILAGLSALADWRQFPGWIRSAFGLVLFSAFHWGPIMVFFRFADFLQWFTIEEPWTVGKVAAIEAQRVVRAFPWTFLSLWVVALSWQDLRLNRRQWKWTQWFSALVAVGVFLNVLGSEAFHWMEAQSVWRTAWVVRPIYWTITFYLAIKAVQSMRHHGLRRSQPGCQGTSPPSDPEKTIWETQSEE